MRGDRVPGRRTIDIGVAVVGYRLHCHQIDVSFWIKIQRMNPDYSAIAYDERRGSAPPISRLPFLRIAFTPPINRDQLSTRLTVHPFLAK